MKIFRWVLIAIAVLGVTAILGLYGWSEILLRQRIEVPLPVIQASTNAGAVARGEHLGTLYGCNGCHERDLTGSEWFDDPMIGRLWTANLTTAMPRYTDAQLARAIRDGVKEDGSSLMGMPSESWVAVTDGDMADLLAWLRTHPPKGQARPGPRLGPMGRFLLIRKEVQPAPAWVAEAKAKPAMEAGPEFAVGRRIAQTVCSECHNSDLKGHPDTPDLLIGAAYDLPRFTRLMRTGIGMDDKEHGLMTEVAKGRFSHFTDQEIADLHAYLTARAEKTP